MTWYIKPSRLTALVKDLCETAGLGFETTGMSLEEAQAAVEKAAPALTLQQRLACTSAIPISSFIATKQRNKLAAANKALCYLTRGSFKEDQHTQASPSRV